MGEKVDWIARRTRYCGLFCFVVVGLGCAASMISDSSLEILRIYLLAEGRGVFIWVLRVIGVNW